MENLMSKDIEPFEKGKQLLEDLHHFDEQGEFWWASEICEPLNYTWRRFTDVINRAILAMTANGEDPSEHIASRTVPSVTGRDQTDYRLSRYGAYVVVQSGDPSKPEIAAGWAYLRIRTREAEVREQQDLELDADLRQIQQMSFAIQQVRNQQRRLDTIQIEQTRAIANQAIELVNHAARLDSIEHNTGWMTALAFARENEFEYTDNLSLNKLGTRAGKITRTKGLEPQKTSDQRFGTVNLYPEDALIEASKQLGWTE